MDEDRDLLDSKDAFARADLIFKSLEDKYSETFGMLAEWQKVFTRQMEILSESYNKMYDNTINFGIVASSSVGCKDIGEASLEMAETYKEITNNHTHYLKSWQEEVDFNEYNDKGMANVRSKWLEKHKASLADVVKATNVYEKLAKKPKNNTKKQIEKMQVYHNDLVRKRNTSKRVVHEMLNQAFVEERTRYCEFMGYQYRRAVAAVEYQENNLVLLKGQIQDWEKLALSSDKLSLEAVALIDNVYPKGKMSWPSESVTFSPSLTRRITLGGGCGINVQTTAPSKSAESTPQHGRRKMKFSSLRSYNSIPDIKHGNRYNAESISEEKIVIPEPDGGKYLALFDWRSNKSDATKLHITKGEILHSTKLSPDGNWIYGCNKNRIFGWFPTSYVKTVNSKKAQSNIIINSTRKPADVVHRHCSVNSLESCSSDNSK